jgi:plastocyanin
MRSFSALLMLLVACGGGDGGGDGDPMGPQQPGPTQFGTVRGRVLSTGDTALAGVGISASRSGFSTRNATTDATGNFTLANLEVGAWNVSASAPTGYEAAGALSSAVTVAANVTVDAPIFRVRRSNPGGPAPSTATVMIVDNDFNPSTVTVAVGGTVTWTNSGSAQHNVTGSTFASTNLNPNTTYQRTFTQAGTVNYSCTLHAGMSGTVVVQ